MAFDNSANEYVPVAVNFGATTTTMLAPEVSSLPLSQALSLVQLKSQWNGTRSGTSKGLYFNKGDGTWLQILSSQDLYNNLYGDRQIAIYTNLTSPFTVPAGAAVYRNGFQVSPAPATIAASDTNVYVVATLMAGAASGVTSFNTRTGAVTLTAADLPAATTSVAGAVKVGVAPTTLTNPLTGGTANTLTDVSASFSQAAINGNFNQVAIAINAIINNLKTAGIMQ